VVTQVCKLTASHTHTHTHTMNCAIKECLQRATPQPHPAYRVRLFAILSTHSLPSIVRVVKSRRMRLAGHVACMGEDGGVHRVLVGKPEGTRSLGRPRRRWEDNIKMDLQEVGGGRGNWMELAQDRDRWRALVGTVRNFRVP
jgi:hypothetical protein